MQLDRNVWFVYRNDGSWKPKPGNILQESEICVQQQHGSDHTEVTGLKPSSGE